MRIRRALIRMAELTGGTQSTMAQTSVAVIGAGNWGSSLIAALRRVGIAPAEVVRRGNWRSAKFDARILWLCVPDATIAETAARIAAQRGDLRGQIVVHSSGALPASVLEPVRLAGARVGAVHPVMTFPTRRVVALKDVMFGVESEDPGTRRTLNALVRRLGGVPFPVDSDAKALYHAAGVMASPLLVSALTAAMKAAQLAGLDAKTSAKWVRALAGATAANVFARGPDVSFSGPFARGDVETIRLHLQALADHPILTGVYQSLARHAVDALPVKNRAALEAALAPRRRLK